MRAGDATVQVCPVLAAGVGARRGWTWVLRTASFRLSGAVSGRSTTGIATERAADGSAVASLLTGLARPAYGELRVLGQDLTTAAGRAAARRLVGVSRRRQPQRGFRVRGMVERATRASGLPHDDRELLTAAILDRLALGPWAHVPVWTAPATVARRTRMAAAAVCEPDLLVLDGLLDDLSPPEAAGLAGDVHNLSRSTAVVVTGCDTAALALACDEVLTLSDGVLVRG